ncbi:tyrosine-protein phosphatase [Amycolatopsis sp. cmx-4-61]|uniref:tyrosine-protein phosphatase n=1 Tax=Amycolatopsis sp. cmx-4-61 TaxID=2790937 RepID=UPI00397C36A4
MTAAARRLLPALLPNLRDAGGLATPTGRIVRTGRLLRSSALVALDGSTAAAVTGLFGAGTYVDLRVDAELERDGEPDALVAHGWRWHRIPLQDRLPGESDEPADVLRRYRRALVRYLDIAGEVAGLPGGAPVIVGCTLGKDRTGLVTAILLHRLGVHRTAILEDFAYTDVCLRRSRHLLPPAWRDPVRKITPVSPPVLDAVLDEIPDSTPLPAEKVFSPDTVRPSGADRAAAARRTIGGACNGTQHIRQ